MPIHTTHHTTCYLCILNKSGILMFPVLGVRNLDDDCTCKSISSSSSSSSSKSELVMTSPSFRYFMELIFREKMFFMQKSFLWLFHWMYLLLWMNIICNLNLFCWVSTWKRRWTFSITVVFKMLKKLIYWNRIVLTKSEKL